MTIKKRLKKRKIILRYKDWSKEFNLNRNFPKNPYLIISNLFLND